MAEALPTLVSLFLHCVRCQSNVHLSPSVVMFFKIYGWSEL